MFFGEPHIHVTWWQRLRAMVRAQGSWTGFETRDETTISFNEGTRTFTIAPKSPLTQFAYWWTGRRIVKQTSESIVISDIEGIHFIYYDGAILIDDPYPPNKNILKDVVFIALIHWDFTNKKATIFGDERHGLMDWWTHNMHHFTEGSEHVAGGKLLNYLLAQNGSSDTHAQIGLESWVMDDEDIRHVCKDIASPVNQYEQTLTPYAHMSCLYRLGSGGLYRRDNPTYFPLKMGITTPVYNLNTAGTWSTPDVTNQRYFVYFILSTNHIYPTMVVPGQAEYLTLTDAKNNAKWENLDLGGFATPEAALFHILYFKANTAYTNSVKATLEDVLDVRRDRIKNLDVSSFL